MIFQSILFQGSEGLIKTETLREPDCFIDLNLDQVIESVTAGKEEYNLKPFFYYPLRDIGSILYRQEIMREEVFHRRNLINRRQLMEAGTAALERRLQQPLPWQ